MLATVLSATLHGIDGRVIRVEVDVAPGLPGFSVVGLADASLQEARERVRGAIRNSGLVFPPRRITVNLAPADLRKTGASLDAAIAVAILLGSEQARADGPWALIGELSLGGELRRVPGILSMVAALARRGVARVVVPGESAAEAGLVDRIAIHPAADLAGALAAIRSGRAARPRANPARVDLVGPGGGATTREAGPGAAPAPAEVPDLQEVRGQAVARRALEIALAGGHALLLVGPPGSGKTLLARTIPGLLPPLDPGDALTTTAIRSAAGEGPILELDTRRPFRAPHHTCVGAWSPTRGPPLRNQAGSGTVIPNDEDARRRPPLHPGIRMRNAATDFHRCPSRDARTESTRLAGSSHAISVVESRHRVDVLGPGACRSESSVWRLPA